MFLRKDTRTIYVRGVPIGGGNPVTVQTMTNTDTKNVDATVNQINSFIAAGCDMVRIAVPNGDTVEALKEIRKQVDFPLIADIHFKYELALKAIEAGVDKLRINPGNIGSKSQVRYIVKAASERKIPIRVGVNAGSLKKELLDRYGRPSPEALVIPPLVERR